MKIRFSTLLLAAAFGFIFYACGSKQAEVAPEPAETIEEMHDHSAEATDTTALGKEYTSTYICPMHCEGSGSEEAGVCPVCGMDYVMNKSLEEAEEGHEGHMH